MHHFNYMFSTISKCLKQLANIFPLMQQHKMVFESTKTKFVTVR